MIEVNQRDIENDIPENAKVWRSCCFNLDSHFVAYVGQFIFTMSGVWRAVEIIGSR